MGEETGGCWGAVRLRLGGACSDAQPRRDAVATEDRRNWVECQASQKNAARTWIGIRDGGLRRYSYVELLLFVRTTVLPANAARWFLLRYIYIYRQAAL